MSIIDVSFDEAEDVTSIAYRLHPIDVGFDLRADDTAIAITRADDPIRVSYPARDGSRRVMTGPQRPVLARLRRLGFRFVSGDR